MAVPQLTKPELGPEPGHNADLPLKLPGLKQTVCRPVPGCGRSSWCLASGPRELPASPSPVFPSEEVLPVGIIAGATIGAGILLTFSFIALAFFLYRRRKGSE